MRTSLKMVAILSAVAALGLCPAASDTSGAPPGQAARAPAAQPSETAQRQADHQAAEADPTPGRMIISAVDDTTGEPLAAVQFQLHGRVGGQVVNQHFETDDEGIAQAHWPPDAVIQNLWMTASKPTFVPIHYVWRSEKQAIEMPARIDLRFQRGTIIVGTVQDEAGQPIAGATLNVSMPITSPRLANYMFNAATLKTDEQGNWLWTDAPADRSGVGIGVAHPDYLPGSSPSKQGENNIAVLKQGYRLVGEAVDQEGDAVVGAPVRLGLDRFGTNQPETSTDAAGRFVLRNCQPGKSLVTVQADGFSPVFQELVVNDQTGNLRFQLEPAHSLTVKVVDVDGRPLSGALFVPDTWRGFRSLELRLNTDADGKVVWKSAPDDEVLCDVLKSGYLSVRRTPLKAGPEVQMVTLHPELVIKGRVTNADTGKPIERFGLREGVIFGNRKDPNWLRGEPTAYTRGSYECKFSEGYDGRVLQVVAEGYLPATSRVFRPTEGTQTFDFELKPGSGPKGTVLLPDGSPAQAAEVALATKEHRVALRAGSFYRDRNDGPDVVKTDAEGRFSFPPVDAERFMIVVVHEAGFAKCPGEDVAKTPIRLAAWGRLDGLVMRGDKPDAERRVTFHPDRAAEERDFFYDYGHTAITDQNGRFSIERVTPGAGSVARVVLTRSGHQRSVISNGWSVPVDVRPGATTKALIGGTGRPVVGQVTLADDANIEVDWAATGPATAAISDKQTRQSGKVIAVSNLDQTGRFEMPDVPAGDYRLLVPLHDLSEPDELGFGKVIGTASLDFTVPAMPGGRSDEPLDLGVIEAKSRDKS